MKQYTIHVGKAFVGVSKEGILFLSITVQMMNDKMAKAVIEKLIEMGLEYTIQQVTTTHEYKDIESIG